jgi:hypothetical protein
MFIHVRHSFRILNSNFLPTLCELTNHLMWNCKNVPILIHLTHWHISFFSRRKWHIVRMRLNITGYPLLYSLQLTIQREPSSPPRFLSVWYPLFIPCAISMTTFKPHFLHPEYGSSKVFRNVVLSHHYVVTSSTICSGYEHTVTCIHIWLNWWFLHVLIVS